MKKILILTIFIIGLLSASNAFAVPILWDVNGHYYEAIAGCYDWDVAKALAESKVYKGAQGHLVTITSQAENDWVWTNIWQSQTGQSSSWKPNSYWLGGYQEPGTSEPYGGWEWVTGEAWSFTNWSSGEPNNCWDILEEDAVIFPATTTIGQWNDISMDKDNTRYGGSAQYKGYIVEYPVPEPATMSLLGLGLLGAFGVRIRRRKNG